MKNLKNMITIEVTELLEEILKAGLIPIETKFRVLGLYGHRLHLLTVPTLSLLFYIPL